MKSGPGRNDPCHCGSGKKYKKCCLGKERPTHEFKSMEKVEPRFCPLVNMYYTVGGVIEALKSQGNVKIHPYVLNKLIEDPHIFYNLPPEHPLVWQQRWHPSKLSPMSEDDIAMKLKQLGVRYDRLQFLEMAKTSKAAWDVADQWKCDFKNCSVADQNFIGLAACELWRRYCPERPSLEMLDDWMCEGYAYLLKKQPLKAFQSWIKLWETIRLRLTPEIENLDQAGERIFPMMSQCLTNWSTDFCTEALNVSLNDPVCGELGLRFIRGVLESLPEEENIVILSGDLATILFNLDRYEEGELCCEDLIQKHPDHPMGYVTLADGLISKFNNNSADVASLERAVELLEKADTYPVKDPESFDLQLRLSDAREMFSTAT